MSTTSLSEQFTRDSSLPDVPYDAVQRTTMVRSENVSATADAPPEQRLMIALVRDSIRCIEKYRHARTFRGKRLFAQEAEWVLSNDTDWLYSFVRVCEALDLDPDSVRRSLGFPTVNGKARVDRDTIAASTLQ